MWEVTLGGRRRGPVRLHSAVGPAKRERALWGGAMSLMVDASAFAEALVQESPDALLALTAEGRVLYWNDGA